jgi:large subunit ribosomal protein L9
MAHHIHVVLTDDIPNLGKSGELVRVRPGFARNYLVPRGLAIGATAGNVARIEHEKKVVEARNAKLKAGPAISRRSSRR